MRNTNGRWALVPAFVVVLLTTAACGNDDSTAQGGATGGEGSSTAPASPFGTACSRVSSESLKMMMTEPVVTAAADNPQLTSLVDDLDLAGLTDSLNTAEALTVFAPTNAAFEALPPGQLEDLLKPANKQQLADILSYHVVQGQLAPDELAGEHETLQGGTLTVEGSGETFTVNGTAMVVCGDIHTDNATVYVIDEVLHP